MLTKLYNYILGVFRLKPRVPWRLCVVVMDDFDRVRKCELPLKDAMAFIEKWSRFKINPTILVTNIPHTLDTWDNGAKIMLRDNIPAKYRESLPVADSYLFLYKTWPAGPPAQGGSTMGVADGIPKGGKARPYATVAADAQWYDVPIANFFSEGSHILVHEIINTINCKLEVPPYSFPTMVVGDSPDPYTYEKGRLQEMKDTYYDKLNTVIASQGEI